jgi:hypothetical protein
MPFVGLLTEEKAAVLKFYEVINPFLEKQEQTNLIETILFHAFHKLTCNPHTPTLGGATHRLGTREMNKESINFWNTPLRKKAPPPPKKRRFRVSTPDF